MRSLIFVFILTFVSIFARTENINIPAEEIIDRMTLSIYGLSSYTCKVKMNANIVDYGINISFKGSVYFKEPNKLALKLDNLPEEVQEKYRISFTQTAVPGMVSKTYKEKYKIKLTGIRNFTNNRKVYILYMEPYKKSSVKNVIMFVDSENYTIPKSIIFYTDGGKIVIEQAYAKIEKYYLPVKQDVLFDFPKIRANLISEFYDYQLNVNIDDQVFEQGKK
ncbi:MAG: hypothetical protein RMJ51_05560 [Candidatus Calescibacterium sp.]|nr:hypothetical protein [Candidatus Calescibacterium sp.]MCX7972422.1 hypothetical protein [bacterium]MDW8195687.1 hypothetical protein [Candidatus Calescibacterium sp.]